MNTCLGFWGKIFGHKFQATYSIVKEGRNAEEIQQINNSISNFNFHAWHDSQIEPKEDDYFKKIEKKYEGHICKRCGMLVKYKNS